MRPAATTSAARPAAPAPGGAGPDVVVPGEPSSAAYTAGGTTLGVEEEFVLLDPSTGAAVLAGPDLARILDGQPGVWQEVMRFQVETATRVCTSLEDLGRELVRLRRLAAGAAESLGCRLVASGIAPYRTPGLAAVTGQPRYRDLVRHYGLLVAETGGACGCHVHVGVPSRDMASKCSRGCGLGSPRCWPSPSTPRSRAAATRPGPAAGTRPGPAGRLPPCPARGRTRPPTTRPSAASSSAAPRSMSGASICSRGCPRATPPWRSASRTPVSMSAPRCCWPG